MVGLQEGRDGCSEARPCRKAPPWVAAAVTSSIPDLFKVRVAGPGPSVRQGVQHRLAKLAAGQLPKVAAAQLVRLHPVVVLRRGGVRACLQLLVVRLGRVLPALGAAGTLKGKIAEVPGQVSTATAAAATAATLQVALLDSASCRQQHDEACGGWPAKGACSEAGREAASPRDVHGMWTAGAMHLDGGRAEKVSLAFSPADRVWLASSASHCSSCSITPSRPPPAIAPASAACAHVTRAASAPAHSGTGRRMDEQGRVREAGEVLRRGAAGSQGGADACDAGRASARARQRAAGLAVGATCRSPSRTLPPTTTSPRSDAFTR